MMLPSKLSYFKKGETVLTEFTPTMLISAKCRLVDCTNKGDFRDMANGVCDQCWVENEEWRKQK